MRYVLICFLLIGSLTFGDEKLTRANTLLSEGHFLEVVQLLKNEPQPEELYPLATALRALQRDEEALVAYSHYLDSTIHQYEEEARLGLVSLYLRQGECDKAEALLKCGVKKQSLLLNHQIDCVRLALKKGEAQEARHLLSLLTPAMASSKKWQPLFHLLWGECEERLGNNNEALSHYSFAFRNEKIWDGEVTYSIAHLLVKMGAVTHAKELFTQLYAAKADNRFLIGLAECELSLSHPQPALLWLEKLEKPSREEERAVALIKSQTLSLLEEKERWLTWLASEETSDYYVPALILRGMNRLDMAKISTQVEATAPFEEASTFFEKASVLTKNRDYGTLARQLQASTQASLGTRRLLKSAFSLLSKVSQEKESREIEYQKALVASHLIRSGETCWWHAAKENIRRALALSPDGYEEAEYLNASLESRFGDEEKGKIAFLNFYKLHPTSPLAPQALFYAGAGEELLLHFNDSPYAFEYLFHRFSYADYVQGGEKAITHLRQMSDSKQVSPFLIHVHFLLAHAEQKKGNSPQALFHFEKALALSHHFFKTGAIDVVRVPHFAELHYRIMLEWAKETMMQGAVEETEKLLLSLLSQLDEKKELPSCFLQGRSFEPLSEEALFWRAMLLQSIGDEEDAASCFAAILTHHVQAKITRGYFLSLTHKELGKMAASHGQLEAATSHFRAAEECAKGRVLSGEEWLDLWIAESDCYKTQNNFSQAMRLLSQALNAEVISPLRLKAMYLRGQLYKEEGRHALARLQWEALGNYAGEWATLAKEQLNDFDDN